MIRKIIRIDKDKCNGCCVEGCESAYDNDNLKSLRSVLNPYREETCNLEHTCNDHGSGVDKCRNRCRTFHCVRQPDVQREHRRLTSTTYEHKHKGCRQNHAACCKSACAVSSCKCSSTVEILYMTSKREVVASCVVAEDEDTDEEEHIGEACHDERLLRSVNGCVQSVVEANEEVRAYAHKLPEHIHLEDVGSKHESEH